MKDNISIKEELQAAVGLYKAGQLLESEAAFEKLKSENSENPDVHNLLGVVQGALGKSDEAVENIKKAIDLKSDSHFFYYNLGQVYKRNYKIDEAITANENSYERNSKYYPAIRELIILLRYRDKYEDALKVAQEAYQNFPDNDDLLNLTGEIYNSLGNILEAENFFAKAIELNENNFHACANLGHLVHGRGETERSKELFEKSLAINPNQPIIQHSLASVTGETPDKPAEEFVVSLFNFYANNFDEHMKALNYKVPEIINEAVRKRLGEKARDLVIIDLGCGTGTAARLLADIKSYILGVDLSVKMIEVSDKTRLYDDLQQGDVVDAIKNFEKQADLIIAADVFIYVGALEDLFASAKDVLKEKGILAFSIEELDGDGFKLAETSRYKHSMSYIEVLADKNNFAIVHNQETGIRKQFDKEIPGRVILLEKN